MHKVQDSRTHNKLCQTLSKLCQNPKKKGEAAAYFFPSKTQQQHKKKSRNQEKLFVGNYFNVEY
jgi:hypothetical protein